MKNTNHIDILESNYKLFSILMRLYKNHNVSCKLGRLIDNDVLENTNQKKDKYISVFDKGECKKYNDIRSSKIKRNEDKYYQTIKNFINDFIVINTFIGEKNMIINNATIEGKNFSHLKYDKSSRETIKQYMIKTNPVMTYSGDYFFMLGNTYKSIFSTLMSEFFNVNHYDELVERYKLVNKTCSNSEAKYFDKKVIF